MQSMPHVKMPIRANREALLSVMVDSCAGLNLGKLSYHKLILKAQLETMEQFTYIEGGLQHGWSVHRGAGINSGGFYHLLHSISNQGSTGSGFICFDRRCGSKYDPWLAIPARYLLSHLHEGMMVRTCW